MDERKIKKYANMLNKEIRLNPRPAYSTFDIGVTIDFMEDEIVVHDFECSYNNKVVDDIINGFIKDEGTAEDFISIIKETAELVKKDGYVVDVWLDSVGEEIYLTRHREIAEGGLYACVNRLTCVTGLVDVFKYKDSDDDTEYDYLDYEDMVGGNINFGKCSENVIEIARKVYGDVVR